MATVIDFSAGVPSALAVKSAGHIGAVRYISPPRESWQKGKPAQPKEKRAYDDAGLKMAYVWQYGKDKDADVRGGRAGGIADAKAAQKQLDLLGVPDAPVFFAVDFDITLKEWNTFGVEYFKGVNSVLGKQRTGIYGHSRVCYWAGPEDGVVAQVELGRYLCWVTCGWSNGETGKDYAVLYQGVVDTPSKPGPKVDGVTVDVNTVYHSEWGWRALPKAKASTPAPTPAKDNAVDIDLSHMISFGGPTPLPKKVVILHATENELGTPAKNIIQYQVNTRTGSYHRLVDGTGKITLANTDGWRTWSTGNIGNDIALHVSVVWWAKTTRPEWLAQQQVLRGVARVFAYWSRTYSIPLRKLSRAELGQGLSGFAGHLEAQVWGNTDHWDPGYHFPYDVVLEMARQINSAPAPKPVQTKIETKTFMEEIMSDKITSRINKNKAFKGADVLAMSDEKLWYLDRALDGLFEVLDIDRFAYNEACKEADNKGKPMPSVINFKINKETKE